MGRDTASVGVAGTLVPPVEVCSVGVAGSLVAAGSMVGLAFASAVSAGSVVTAGAVVTVVIGVSSNVGVSPGTAGCAAPGPQAINSIVSASKVRRTEWFLRRIILFSIY